jgi:hypothetical protein
VRKLIIYGVKKYMQYDYDDVIALFDSFEKAEKYAIEISKDTSMDWHYIQEYELNNPDYEPKESDEYITYEKGKKIIN